ncbi:MAG: hypothetical protein SNJ63_05570 [Sphingomonadaceae bacterium]
MTTTFPLTHKLVTLFAAILLSTLNLAAFAVPVAPNSPGTTGSVTGA